jgi:hypothetical protein
MPLSFGACSDGRRYPLAQPIAQQLEPVTGGYTPERQWGSCQNERPLTRPPIVPFQVPGQANNAGHQSAHKFPT